MRIPSDPCHRDRWDSAGGVAIPTKGPSSSRTFEIAVSLIGTARIRIISARLKTRQLLVPLKLPPFSSANVHHYNVISLPSCPFHHHFLGLPGLHHCPTECTDCPQIWSLAGTSAIMLLTENISPTCSQVRCAGLPI